MERRLKVKVTSSLKYCYTQGKYHQTITNISGLTQNQDRSIVCVADTPFWLAFFTIQTLPFEHCGMRSDGIKHFLVLFSQERDHMVRMSRKFFASPRKCEQVPEEVCQSYRVNPRPVMKEIKRKVCRRPETEASSYDRSLVERLQEWAKVSVGGSPP